jgi:hypothetical protein
MRLFTFVEISDALRGRLVRAIAEHHGAEAKLRYF